MTQTFWSFLWDIKVAITMKPTEYFNSSQQNSVYFTQLAIALLLKHSLLWFSMREHSTGLLYCNGCSPKISLLVPSSLLHSNMLRVYPTSSYILYS